METGNKTYIFERMRNGELIHVDDIDYFKVQEAIIRAFRITGELNSQYRTADEARVFIEELTLSKIDSTTRIMPPFYTDFGQFIKFGKDVFVNFGCTFMDRGGITIEDNVFIGPNAKLITENHAEEPHLRHNVYGKEILIKEKAWIGAGSIILPGVTIGKNAIVGAGSIVTRNVEDNSIVAGNPAKFIRKIKT
jgi:hypothetical protein